MADVGRTLPPNTADSVQPLVKHRAEAPGARVGAAADLARQSNRAEKRNRLLTLRGEAARGEPKTKRSSTPGRCDQDFERFQASGNWIRHHFREEFLGERENVLAADTVTLIPDRRLAQRKKLNRVRWTTRTVADALSVPKNIVAPSQAVSYCWAAQLRYSEIAARSASE